MNSTGITHGINQVSKVYSSFYKIHLLVVIKKINTEYLFPMKDQPYMKRTSFKSERKLIW